MFVCLVSVSEQEVGGRQETLLIEKYLLHNIPA